MGYILGYMNFRRILCVFYNLWNEPFDSCHISIHFIYLIVYTVRYMEMGCWRFEHPKNELNQQSSNEVFLHHPIPATLNITSKNCLRINKTVLRAILVLQKDSFSLLIFILKPHEFTKIRGEEIRASSRNWGVSGILSWYASKVHPSLVLTTNICAQNKQKQGCIPSCNLGQLRGFQEIYKHVHIPHGPQLSYFRKYMSL